MLPLKSARRALFVVAAIGLCGVSVAGAPAPFARSTDALAPELSGLGTLHVPVSTATQISVPPEFFETIVSESLKVPARVWKAALEPILTVDFSERLKEVAVPTLLVWGDRDGFTGRAEQDALNRAIAGSRLTVYSGTGHCPHWEEPERFAADVVAFVRSVDAP